MAKKSKATKTVLASLLATSVIVPAIAVNAEVGGEITRAVETTSAVVTKTIDFKVEDTTGHLGSYIKGPGNLVEMQGNQYIEIVTTDAVLAMITSATVDGKTIIVEHSGKKHIYVNRFHKSSFLRT